MDKIRDKNGLTEEEFLEKYKEKNYPRPYLTADIVVIGLKGEQKKLLLIQRGGHPVGQQEIHEHEALGGGHGRRLYCRLTSFSRSLQTILRINLDGTKSPAFSRLFSLSGITPVRSLPGVCRCNRRTHGSHALLRSRCGWSPCPIRSRAYRSFRRS